MTVINLRSAVWALIAGVVLALSGTTAHAQCVIAGSTVTCSGTTVDAFPPNGFGNTFFNGFTINVQPGASVTGTNDGIEQGANAVINNAGTITGLNNRGILSSDANINNSGTISGGFEGISYNAAAATPAAIVNSGTISGVLTGIATGAVTLTLDNSGIIAATGPASTGISVFGNNPSTIGNSATGTISGTFQGIGATNANITNRGTISGGTYGASISNGDITNFGTISGTTGAGIQKNQGGNITNSGTVTGDTGIEAIVFSPLGVTNSGTITGTGGTALNFGGILATVTLLAGSQVNGSVVLGDSNTLGNAGTIQVGANGVSISTSGDSNAVTNTGRIDGRLDLSSGAANNMVNSGLLTITNPGTPVGAVHSIGGNFSQTASGTLAIRVNSAGAGDKVSAGGTATLTGGTVRVVASPGSYAPSTTYTILTATGGVAGTFTSVTSNFAFLAPTLAYDANNVFLTLFSSGAGPVNLCSVAATRNQCSTATAVQAGGTGSVLYNAVIAQSADGARQAFDALSGEIHGSLQSSLVDDSRYVRHGVLGRLQQAPRDDQGYSFWTEALGAWGRFESDGNAATTTRSLGGVLVGADRRFDAWLTGFAAGYSHARVNVDARASAADIDSLHFAGYLGTALAGFNLRAGAAYAFHTISTTRSIVFPGFADTARASYGASTGQLFGEVGYGATVGPVAFEPFAGLAWARASTNGFAEAGGAAALTGSGNTLEVGYSTLGLRAAASVALGNGLLLVPRASAVWQHALGNVTPSAALAFRDTGQGFTIGGAPMAQDSVQLDAGLDLQLTRRVRLGIAYVGQLAGNVADHSANARVRWAF